MSISKRLKNQHLFWRAGFGFNTEELALLESTNPTTLYEKIAQSANTTFNPIKVVSLQTLEEISVRSKKSNDRKEINQFHQANIKQLSTSWLDEMVNSPAQLREKLSLFWHGHFACRINNSYHQELLLNIIRKDALGNFGDLLRNVSKSAAILAFLNNQQNKKKKPNENFAREVMELFTMGIGHYSEQDIKESARAFTGWSYNAKGDFLFRAKVHDDGIKTVLGLKGHLTGDDILNLLLEQRATADYISQKIYKHFVNDTVNPEQVNWLSKRFYENNYNIQLLLTDIFTSDWFYDQQNVGVLIKSPVELTTGIRRTLPMTIRNQSSQILIQRLLGQWLFNPPNVAGWPGGKAWIDSSSLMLRLKLPQLIKEDEIITFKPKSNDDTEMGNQQQVKSNRYQIMADIHWNAWSKNFLHIDADKLLPTISGLLLLQQTDNIDQGTVRKFIGNKNFGSSIEAYTLAIMSLPEYQLC
jgi:uncharacterized protein (DUF1800 family)